MLDIMRLSLWKTKQLRKAAKICIKTEFANFPNLKVQKIVGDAIFKVPSLGMALNQCRANLSDLYYTMHWLLSMYSDDPQFFSIASSSGHFVPLSIAFFGQTISYSVSAWQSFSERDPIGMSQSATKLKEELERYFTNDNYQLPVVFE